MWTWVGLKSIQQEGFNHSENGNKTFQPLFLSEFDGFDPRLDVRRHVFIPLLRCKTVNRREKPGFIPLRSKAQSEHLPPQLLHFIVQRAFLLGFNLQHRDNQPL